MWGLLEFLLHASFVWAKRSTACLDTPNCLSLHDERELGAIKDGSWIEGNVTMISQNKENWLVGQIWQGQHAYHKDSNVLWRSSGGNEHTSWRWWCRSREVIEEKWKMRGYQEKLEKPPKGVGKRVRVRLTPLYYFYNKEWLIFYTYLSYL